MYQHDVRAKQAKACDAECTGSSKPRPRLVKVNVSSPNHAATQLRENNHAAHGVSKPCGVIDKLTVIFYLLFYLVYYLSTLDVPVLGGDGVRSDSR